MAVELMECQLNKFKMKIEEKRDDYMKIQR